MCALTQSAAKDAILVVGIVVTTAGRRDVEVVEANELLDTAPLRPFFVTNGLQLLLRPPVVTIEGFNRLLILPPCALLAPPLDLGDGAVVTVRLRTLAERSGIGSVNFPLLNSR